MQVTICEEKLKSLKEVFGKLDYEEGEKDIYWMAKRRQTKTNY